MNAADPKHPGAPTPQDLEDDEGPLETVPAVLVADLPRKPLEPRSERDPKAFEALKNRPVEVHANGVVYRGILQGSDGLELYLRTDTRYITVSMERVSRVVATDKPPQPLAQTGVDPAYFKPLPGEED